MGFSHLRKTHDDTHLRLKHSEIKTKGISPLVQNVNEMPISLTESPDRHSPNMENIGRGKRNRDGHNESPIPEKRKRADCQIPNIPRIYPHTHTLPNMDSYMSTSSKPTSSISTVFTAHLLPPVTGGERGHRRVSSVSSALGERTYGPKQKERNMEETKKEKEKKYEEMRVDGWTDGWMGV